MDQELRKYAERKGIDPETFNTETRAIVCSECDEQPGLVVTGEYNGIVISCECDDVWHSLDSLSYEYKLWDLPDSWESTRSGKGDN